MPRHARPRPAPDVVSRVLDGEAVLLQLGRGEYFGLNAVGTRIWELIAERATVADIQERIVDEFAVDRSTAERDVDDLVGRLVERSLIVIEETTAT